jgi:hypothetical protein
MIHHDTIYFNATSQHMIFCSSDFGAVAPGTRVEDRNKGAQSNEITAVPCASKNGDRDRSSIEKTGVIWCDSKTVFIGKPTVLGCPILRNQRFWRIQFILEPSNSRGLRRVHSAPRVNKALPSATENGAENWVLKIVPRLLPLFILDQVISN